MLPVQKVGILRNKAPLTTIKGHSADTCMLSGTRRLPGITEAARLAETNDSENSWTFVQQCYKECRTEHPACRAIPQSWRPPRLILIDGTELRLSTRFRGNSSYVALRYCSDAVRAVRTTRDNLAVFEQQIPQQAILPVVSDAVAVARRLEHAYLWVDRLCIQQDDVEDLTNHFEIRHKIYSCAAVVVSAVSSASAIEPFLGSVSSLPRRQPQSASLVLKGLTESEGDWQLHIRENLEVPLPLDTSGWAFQERLTATRNIRYEPGELLWECASLSRRESNPKAEERFQLHSLGAMGQWNTRYCKRLVDLRGGGGWKHGWQQVVQDYTRRRLASPRDRLHAPSSIANVFKRASDLQYLAGLWRVSLLEDIGWCVERSVPVPGNVRFSPGSPSWSWASLNCAITWPAHGVPYWSAQPVKGLESANVVVVQCAPETSDRFGPVKLPAELRLIALVLDVDLGVQYHWSSQRNCRLGTWSMKRQDIDFIADDSVDLYFDIQIGLCSDEDTNSENNSNSTTTVPEHNSTYHVGNFEQSAMGSVTRRWRRMPANSNIKHESGDTASIRLLLLDQIEADGAFKMLMLSPVRNSNTFERIGLCKFDVTRKRLSLLEAEARREEVTIV